MEKSGVAVHPMEKSGVAVDPMEKSGVAVHPMEKSGVAVDPMEKSGVAVHPMEKSGVAVDPMEKSGVAVHPMEKSGVAVHPTEESSIPKRSTTPCHVRLNCIQLLKNILSSLYLVPEQDQLRPIYDNLEETWSIIQKLIPRNKGLPLRTTALGIKRLHPPKYRPLPSRRKRRKPNSQHGAKSRNAGIMNSDKKSIFR
jgi:hypothetical protein